MSLLDPRVWMAIMALCLASYAGGRFQQWRADDRKAQAARLEATEEARERERNAYKAGQEIADAKTRNLRAINDRLRSDLDGLRNRPERLSETSRATCAGASGADLSRPDAEFLVGLAANADRLRAALDACQRRERSTFEAMN